MSAAAVAKRPTEFFLPPVNSFSYWTGVQNENDLKMSKMLDH